MKLTVGGQEMFPSYPREDWWYHREALDAAIQRVLTGGNYVLGDEVQAFERSFAASVGVSHAIGVANGTDAIELILRALCIGSGDRVAVPSFTAGAVAAAVTRAGAEVVLVDIEPASFTMCPRSLEAVLRSSVGAKVKAAVVVHLFGHPAQWEELKRVADAHDVELIEDGAQAHGAVYQGQCIGSLARASAFSFYPTKNLGAIGDGGAVVTRDAELAERIRELRQYGWRQRYLSESHGINSRLDELQAAILRVKLAGLPAQIMRRRMLADGYAKLLQEEGTVKLPTERASCEHAWHQYVIRTQQREALKRYLTSRNVPVAVHYPAALHQQPAYQHIPRVVPLTQTERAVSEVLTLPLHPHLTEAAIAFVAQSIRSFCPLVAHAVA